MVERALAHHSANEPLALGAVRVLLQLSVRGAEVREAARRDLSACPEPVLERAAELLVHHRLLARAGHAVIEHGVESSLPSAITARLRNARDRRLEHNRRGLTLYAELLADLRARGFEPILLKSSALVALLYPEQGAHEMGDVDLLVDAEAMPAVKELLGSRGYSAQGCDDETVEYDHPSGGLRLDLHHRFRVFEHLAVDDVALDRPAAFPGLGTVRVFEPNALLAHLVFHMNEHRRSLGYRLRWIGDIGLALRQWPDEFDWERIRRLLPSRQHRCWILRAVRFCQEDFGLRVPPGLEALAPLVEPFDLEEVFRSQRIDPWPLSSPRGWARMGACALGLSQREHRLYPRLRDVLDRARDVREERRALERTPDDGMGPKPAQAGAGQEALPRTVPVRQAIATVKESGGP